MVLLNVPIPQYQDISIIWNAAHKIACTDGAVNRLKEYVSAGNGRLERGPDYIIGDFDSLKRDSLDWLSDQFGEGSFEVHQVNDQNTTDFDKSLLFINEMEPEAKVVALNCFGGRLDHTMAILNSANRFEKEFGFTIELRNEASLARIIYQKHAEISYDAFLSSNCGILPLFGPVRLETSGMEWDLEKSQTSRFGGLVSTSNRVAKETVSIENDSEVPYIWTHEI